jgi:hypothetical protein
MKKNKTVKPTQKQRKAFENIKAGMNLKDSLLKAGYSPVTATHPKQNVVDSPGMKSLIEQYREDLMKAGITKEVLAEIQAEGLFDQNAGVRLGYLKETKKDFGLSVDLPTNQTNIQINAGDFFADVKETL